MVYRPEKTIGNEHQKFTTMDKYKAKDVVKPAPMQVAELERGSTAYNSAILALINPTNGSKFSVSVSAIILNFLNQSKLRFVHLFVF